MVPVFQYHKIPLSTQNKHKALQTDLDSSSRAALISSVTLTLNSHFTSLYLYFLTWKTEPPVLTS